MTTMSIEQLRNIEMTALKGKAVAALLATACPLDECSTEDIQLAVYAIESYFGEILKVLDTAAVTPCIDAGARS